MTNVKAKLSAVADKVSNSKLYKGAEKVAVSTGLALSTAGISAMNALAASEENVDFTATITAAANVNNIMKNAAPFIEPAIIIMCAVAGLRLGMRFLRGSAR